MRFSTDSNNSRCSLICSETIYNSIRFLVGSGKCDCKQKCKDKIVREGWFGFFLYSHQVG
jgi:hypothetical protein